MNTILIRLKKVSLSFMFLLLVLTLSLVLDYIDLNVVLTIYLPVFLIGLLAALLGFTGFTNIFFIFAGIGLFTEYLLRMKQDDQPRMTGAFINTLLLFAGVVLGTLFQYFKHRKEKEGK